MIQIREDSFFWKCYKRYYKGITVGDNPPHPKSVCNLFWKAIGGMCKWLYFDSNIAFALLVLGVLIAGMVWPLLYIGNTENNHFIFGIAFLALFIGLCGTCIFTCMLWIERFTAYWKPKGTTGELVLNGTWVLFGIFLGSLLFSLFWTTKDTPWSLWFLLYGFLTLLGIAAITIGGFIGIMLVKDNEVMRSYLGSFKDWVCPLVKAPWEEEAKNESNGKDAGSTNEDN